MMEVVLRVGLGAVLLMGALAKARDVSAAAGALAPHGVRPGLRRPLAVGLVLLEAGLALALLVGIALPGSAWAAAALLALFAAAFLRLRMNGARTAACGCFGAFRERITLVVAARATALGAAAGYLALGAPAPGAPSQLTALWIAAAVLALAVAALAVLVLALYRQVGVLSLRLGPRTALELDDEGPGIATPAPALPGLVRSGPELVAFVSPSCRLCAELAPGLRALAREGLAVHTVREDEQPSVFARWSVPGAPYVVYVEGGVVGAKGLVNTLEQIDGVIATGRERRAAA